MSRARSHVLDSARRRSRVQRGQRRLRRNITYLCINGSYRYQLNTVSSF